MKKRIFSFALAVILCASIACPAALAAEDKTVHIASAAELRAFAEDCILDEYSAGLKVVLDCDIDLEGEPFYPIPSFSGSFDGNGHTIKNFVLATDGSHQGFFRYLQLNSVVNDLNLVGRVEPGSSRSQVGGIVGTNRGTVSGCSFTGSVDGLNYVGGIVGENLGTVSNSRFSGTVSGKRFTGGITGYSTGSVFGCTNNGDINTAISAGGLELNDINLSSVTGLNLTNAEDTNIVSDTGGIAGFSSGVISGCKNLGTVGYPHYGYNIGGIAGRQSGYINACENSGTIYGRKDVAGIVGQMEPYLLLKDTASLAREIQVLQGMINAAVANSSALSSDMAYALQGIGAGLEDWYKDLTPDISGGGISVPGLPDIGGGSSGGSGVTPSDAAAAKDFIDNALGGGDTPPAPVSAPGDAPAETAPGALSAYIVPSMAKLGKASLRSPLRMASTVVPGSLDENLNVMDMELDNFANIVGWSGEVIANDLGGIGNQLARVLIMAANMFSGATKPVVYEDVSGKEPSDSIQGRVNACVNSGRVEGDSNVGGIAGDMGIEYEFDMENALLSKLEGTNIISQTFFTKCISSRNTNKGAVVGKKDNIGGIAGQSQVGTVTLCENYGNVESTDGDYVGGIVGYSLTSVTASYSMCELNGVEYVGGIVGKGKVITDCVSIVGLNDVTACAGAIAGFADVHAEDDPVKNNVYVGAHMGGIDGISYGGKAEAVSYEKIKSRPNLPDGFGRLKLSFVADGVEVAVIYFDYGGSVDEATLPPVPEKEGFNGSWGEHDYTDLRFSTVIEAVYVPHQAALAAQNTREDSPLSVVLIEGDFSNGAKLHLAPCLADDPAAEFGEVREKWVLSIDNAKANDEYSIRYLEPEHVHPNSRVDIYVLENGEWHKQDTSRNGSYLVFKAKGDKVIFCSVEKKDAQSMRYVIIAAVAAAVLIPLIIFLRIRAKKKSKAENLE